LVTGTETGILEQDAGNREKYFGKGTGKGKRPRRKQRDGEGNREELFETWKGRTQKPFPVPHYSTASYRVIHSLDVSD
jgi:hypothetical protein